MNNGDLARCTSAGEKEIECSFLSFHCLGF